MTVGDSRQAGRFAGYVPDADPGGIFLLNPQRLGLCFLVIPWTECSPGTIKGEHILEVPSVESESSSGRDAATSKNAAQLPSAFYDVLHQRCVDVWSEER
jgi:hypothetical protein